MPIFISLFDEETISRIVFHSLIQKKVPWEEHTSTAEIISRFPVVSHVRIPKPNPNSLTVNSLLTVNGRVRRRRKPTLLLRLLTKSISNARRMESFFSACRKAKSNNDNNHYYLFYS